jgi:glycosyltransferase involved in cell wall biosynthesis
MSSSLSNQSTSLALPAKARLTVIVITKNEAHNIADCLASVAFADEWVVLDNASSDNTAELAKACGAVVHTTADWPGFGIQKNRALAYATGDWVLSLDADERVSTALRVEIERVIQASAHPSGAANEACDVDGASLAYEIPRLSSYCGQYMLHSGWYPDRVLRLFQRDAAHFSSDVVHESLRITQAVCRRLCCMRAF